MDLPVDDSVEKSEVKVTILERVISIVLLFKSINPSNVSEPSVKKLGLSSTLLNGNSSTNLNSYRDSPVSTRSEVNVKTDPSSLVSREVKVNSRFSGMSPNKTIKLD